MQVYVIYEKDALLKIRKGKSQTEVQVTGYIVIDLI